MRARLFLAPCIFVLSFVNPAAVLAGNITYYVEPVSLDDGNDEGYSLPAIGAGFITTNGTLGPLSAADILDYRFSVSGPIPFEFTPLSPFAALYIGGAIAATPTQILVPVDTDPSSTENVLYCSVSLGAPFPDPSVLSISFRNSFIAGSGHAAYVSYTVLSAHVYPLAFAFVELDPAQAYVVATIPEPSSLWLALLGILGACFVTRRRSPILPCSRVRPETLRVTHPSPSKDQ